MHHITGLLTILSLLVQPTVAVLIQQWTNCLGASVTQSEPLQLQWVPLYVEAGFEHNDSSHNLKVTVYGNVTGSYGGVSLPPSTSDDWNNPNFTDGKILRNPFPTTAAKITTLHDTIDVLTYEPYAADFDFCASALFNGVCPLGPVFDTTNIEIPYGLPAMTMDKTFYTSYAFTSFSPTFEIIYGDAQKSKIGCVSVTVTPDLGDLAWMLSLLPMAILVFVGVATIFASIYSPWGTTDIYHWSSNFGRHNDLLRLVTPGFSDCLQYIQFIALTGGLTLNYPGFYQPVVSRVSWSALMFNESFVSKDPGWQGLVDGIYHTNGTYGLQEYAQLVGMGKVEDIWAGMMVWLMVLIASITVITQVVVAIQWVYRYVRNVQEEDLRNKNLPFTVGNVIRIVFNYFLLPLVALSMFQLVVFTSSPAYTVGLAAVTILLLLVFAGWLLRLITTTKPRSVLFDDLWTVLLYGPLYNTYSDEAAAFALIPVLLTFIRGIGIGAVQPAGIAQIIILAICEVVQVITLHAFKPFSSPTSMNAYHTLFSVLRFATIILMTAFVPQLEVGDGPKGWVGYVILLIHGGVLVLCFMLNALQTVIEVIARLMGAGGEDNKGLSQGPLSRIFGARQLSRRTSRRGAQSRQSQLSSTAMLAAGEAGKGGYIAPSGRVRSESAGSVRVMMNQRHQRSSSAFDGMSFDAPPSRLDNGSAFTPTTPGEASTYSFLPSPAVGQNRHAMPASALMADAPGDTFYRPPRRRRPTLENQSTNSRARASWATSGDFSERRRSQVGPPLEPVDVEANDRGVTAPAAYSSLNFPTRNDYATREVDFYYGVQRGSKLNSGAPQRRLGTGPADPTGPVATATGWFRNVFGGKRKEKGKGFEVVRSARMPPAMRAGGGDYDDTDPPEGTPVAMGVLRSGPIDSDSDDGRGKPNPTTVGPEAPAPTEPLLDGDRVSLDDSGDEAVVPRAGQRGLAPTLPDVDTGSSFHVPSRKVSKASRVATIRNEEIPEVPRKSSKRKSDLIPGLTLDLDTPVGNRPNHQPSPRMDEQQQSASGSSRLPFERRRSLSNHTPSVSSMGDTEESSGMDIHRVSSEHRPTSIGTVHVHHGNISRFPSDHRGKVQGREAEFVDE
ncbi:hypothetical protein M406DRAFT_293954 [Cryphonectria parasitica EP155]|uniref:ML-like domain-containing protein n=1 Tax=Cryphonectria parasitica (strain ATCC 38755 / EP155) TaxID=660469 RepID=A0A9P5CKQ5_CRYP1|nr:uncharacterized protein M406DRAFT_293954 [Cryphonectria parasitica EP155]KAF3762303.1 hypothetical protein M406DRAFT_293954 [Cryphonectria parasitica EP155]